MFRSDFWHDFVAHPMKAWFDLVGWTSYSKFVHDVWLKSKDPTK